MQVILRVKRQRGPEDRPYWQEFSCEAGPDASVLSLLEEINSRSPLTDRAGAAAEAIAFESGCRQMGCGACAMLIDGYPRLACSTFLRQLKLKEGVVTVAPLSKFPLLRDLRVDRSALTEDVKRMKLWLNADAVVDKKELPYAYQSASCLMCGCCAEICPNYQAGTAATGSAFTGAAVMNQAYRAASQYPPGKERRRLLKENVAAGQGHCSRTLSCLKVCPLELPLDYIISRGSHMYLKSLFERDKRHEK